MTSQQLLGRHLSLNGTPMHFNTIVKVPRDKNMVWKRTRHSLKKRDEAAFRAAAVELEELKGHAASGEIVLGYLDEAGFAQVHPNRSAWTLRGQQHLISAMRGKLLLKLLSRNKYFYKNAPSTKKVNMQDVIRSEGMALDVCYAYVSNIYGKRCIDTQKPYRRMETKNSWIIHGSLPVNFCGGVFEFEISKSDGRILKLTHSR
jgi:hypothetical protein